jgi:hypothetical protein
VEFAGAHAIHLDGVGGGVSPPIICAKARRACNRDPLGGHEEASAKWYMTAITTAKKITV